MATDVSEVKKRRVTLKPSKCPNPLFEKWLEEWKNEAAIKESDLQYCFGKALNSLRKFPLPLNSGKACGVLSNFGTRLCVMLDRRLAEYRKDHPEEIGDVSDVIVPPPAGIPVAEESKQMKPKSQKKKSNTNNGSNKTSGVRKPKQYLPAWRSAPYAILLTLLEESNHSGFLTKEQLQSMAQPHCDSSFTKADPGTFYTGWSSMAGLVKRGLVLRQGCPIKFSLTEAGMAVARQLRHVGNASPSKSHSDTATCVIPEQTSDGCCSAADPVSASDEIMCLSDDEDSSTATSSNGKTTSSAKTRDGRIGLSHVDTNVDRQLPQKRLPPTKRRKSPPQQKVVMDDTVFVLPGSFDVILLVDKKETAGGSTLTDLSKDPTVAELSATGVLFELRHLTVGDFTWICRSRESGHEMVLPYIVERKRMDDLASSIRDGRFHEQKFRLKQSGIQNLIYLVESHGDNLHTSLPLETLNQAVINTQVTDKFTVKTTSHHRHSMLYLATVTRMLTTSYRNKTLVSCHRDNLPPANITDDLVSLMTFTEFNAASSKTKMLGNKAMFLKQLLQLNGLSVEKARAIVEQYPTPRVLMAAYQEQSSDGDKLLANIRYGALNRLVGPVISRALHQFYTNQSLS